MTGHWSSSPERGTGTPHSQAVRTGLILIDTATPVVPAASYCLAPRGRGPAEAADAPGQHAGGAEGIAQGARAERLTGDSYRAVPGRLCLGKVFTREDGS
ncbi:hypothetical protein GCM10010433_43590 [Streptomyces pulveraceus]